MRRIAKSAFLLVLVCFAVLAQEDRGTMRGLIKDPTGAIVPNASVTVVNVATNSQFKTSSGASTGEFTIPSLGVAIDCKAALREQELVGERNGPVYWEGAVTYSGSASGVGYLEMTGYDKPVEL